jgi:serine/threonine protein kinase
MAASKDNWERIKELFEAALRLSAPQRRDYLKEQGIQADVSEEVLGLISEDDESGSTLSKPSVSPPESSRTRELLSGGLFDGKFKIVQLIAVGGMGEVWLAEQTKPIHRMVALKLIKQDANIHSEAVVARFEAERQALALMDHPNIARVYDAGSAGDGQPYFAMEYVPGMPITQFCDKRRLTLNERLELFLQVCDGVQHAHQKAIIHRDLKPSNLLVVEQDDRLIPKIIDFGLAKATWGRLTEKTMFTKLGVVIGTPEYMSPEQADQNEHHIDTRTDVYSLGVILFELLTGTVPFSCKKQTIYELLRQIREDDPPRPSQMLSKDQKNAEKSAALRRAQPGLLIRRLRCDLDWIAIKALEKSIARRYDSPGSLAADIKRHLTDQPVSASPPSLSYQANKFFKRHTVGVLAAAAMLLVLVALAASMTWQNIRIRRAETKLRQALVTADEILSSTGRLKGKGDSRMSRFQKDLLDKMYGFYTRLAEQEPRNEEIGKEAALAQASLGDIDRLLANYARAIKEYGDAIGRFEKLHANHPENPEYRSSLANAHNYLGEVLRLRSEEEEKQSSPPDERQKAEIEYASAMRLLEDLQKQQPQNRKFIQELARTHNNRGILRYDQGEFDKAQSDFKQTIELLNPLVRIETESSTDEEPPSVDLARAQNNLGILLRSEEQLKEGQRHAEEAIQIEKDLIERHPDNFEYAVELATFYNNLSFFLFEKGDVTQAKQHNHAALDEIEDLATPSPSMETQRAKAHMLHLALGPSEHPAFHELQKHLGEEYVKLAKDYVESGNLAVARMAIGALKDSLPSIAEPDRSRLEKLRMEIEKELQENENNRK